MAINTIIEDGLLTFEQSSNEFVASMRETAFGKDVGIELIGKLTSELQHEFEDELTSLSLVFKRVIIDCNRLDYISNSILKSMLQIQQQMEAVGGELILKNVNESILISLKNMGLLDVLDIR